MTYVAPEKPGKVTRAEDQEKTGAPEAGAKPAVRQIFLADPAPLGLAALALPLAALSWINIGYSKPTAIPVVLTTLLVYGALGQFAVAMWEVLRGNMFGVVAFGTFGCFNLALWHFFTYQMPKISPSARPSDLALFLGLWAIPAFILWVASLRTTLVINLIFMLATALFVVAAWGEGATNVNMIKAAGWLGVALAAIAWYGCASALTADTFGRRILPNPQLGPAKKAQAGGPAAGGGASSGDGNGWVMHHMPHFRHFHEANGDSSKTAAGGRV